jgi:AcrR family transcriptional regulator
VVDPPVRSEGARLTARGAATRERIVLAAAELMAVKGVAATTLDEVRVASGTSKSQLYHHFAAKEALVREVVAYQAGVVLERQYQLLRGVSSVAGLRRWRNAVLQRNVLRSGAYGCEIGTLAAELSDTRVPVVDLAAGPERGRGPAQPHPRPGAGGPTAGTLGSSSARDRCGREMNPTDVRSGRA